MSGNGAKAQPPRALFTSFKAIDACPPGAPCYAKNENNSQQLRETQHRCDVERTARLQLNEKFEKLSQQYVSLNQQHNVTIEHCRRGDHAYRELEKALRHSQKDLSYVRLNHQNLQQFFDQERRRMDARLNRVLETTGMLAQSLCSFFVDHPPEYPTEQKQDLKGECEALKEALVKQREMHSLQAFGGVQGGMPWWPS